MTEFWNLLVPVVVALWELLLYVGSAILYWLLPISWIAWWLFGVNWNRAWPALRSGAWVGVVLFMFVGAFVWSQLAPSDYNVLSIVSIPNFWWQLLAVAILTGLTLFCGWLQGVMGWTPAEIDLDAAEHAGDAAGHGHH
jgi:hypothetical protein